jgi:hypothetical protein
VKQRKPFDLTAELRGVAKRLQERVLSRPHRAAGDMEAFDMEAFDMIQAEATRLLAATALTRGLTLAEGRLSTYAVTKKQAKLVNELRVMLRGEIKRRNTR